MRHYSQEQLHPDYLKLRYFFPCNIEREQKKRERTNSTKYSTYLYIYIARRDKNFWNGYQRPTYVFINRKFIVTKTLDKTHTPVRSPAPFLLTSFYMLQV